MPHKTYFNWSSGKDSALALYHLLQDKHYQVDLLITSINTHYDRVSMHGLRRALLEQQVKSIAIPHDTIDLPEEPTMEEYEQLMKKTVTDLTTEGYTTAAFGDIFLEDLKNYREEQLRNYTLDAVFPIWKRDTTALMQEFIELGFKAIVVCVKADLLDESFVGRTIDQDFIKDLPDNVDPCGENGEFHTFCFDGPIFNHPVSFEIGEKVYREYKAPKEEKKDHLGFWFCDLLPKD